MSLQASVLGQNSGPLLWQYMFLTTDPSFQSCGFLKISHYTLKYNVMGFLWHFYTSKSINFIIGPSVLRALTFPLTQSSCGSCLPPLSSCHIHGVSFSFSIQLRYLWMCVFLNVTLLIEIRNLCLVFEESVNLLVSSHYIFRSPPSGRICNKYRNGLGWGRWETSDLVWTIGLPCLTSNTEPRVFFYFTVNSQRKTFRIIFSTGLSCLPSEK